MEAVYTISTEAGGQFDWKTHAKSRPKAAFCINRPSLAIASIRLLDVLGDDFPFAVGNLRQAREVVAQALGGGEAVGRADGVHGLDEAVGRQVLAGLGEGFNDGDASTPKRRQSELRSAQSAYRFASFNLNRTGLTMIAPQR